LQYAESLNVIENQIVEMSTAENWVNQLLVANQVEVNYYPAINGLSFGSFIRHETKKILLVNPGINDQEINDLPSLLTVLGQHYQGVKVVLSLDIWQNPDRTKQNLLTFFMDS